MTQPAATKIDDQPPCGKDCDSCQKAQTCEAMTPVLSRLVPAGQFRQPGSASWK